MLGRWPNSHVGSVQLHGVTPTSGYYSSGTDTIHRYGVPQVFNTDQGSQFTSQTFTDELKQHQIKISMDGKGCWMDNVFIERLWRSVKYEEVYLHAYDSIPQARDHLKRYFEFYNAKRKHQTLKAAPDQVYYAHLPSLKKAG